MAIKTVGKAAKESAKERGLFERPKDSNVWWIQWFDNLGQRHREKAGSKACARQLYAKRKTEALQNKKLPELGRRELTVRDLTTRYVDEIRANKKSAAWDERIAKLWVAEIGDIGIDYVQPGDIERVKAKWLKTRKPSTVNRRLAYLKTMFGKAVRDGLTERNPVGSGRVKMLRESPPPERFLSDDEEADVLPLLGPMERLAVVVALHTGLRISEQVERQRSECSLARGVISIPDAKGGGRQEVRLGPNARAALEELLASHDSPWLFPDSTGQNHVNRGVLSRRFSRALAKANIKGVRWHTLRHSFISRLVIMGENIIVVQRLARHKSLAMTLRYAHLAPDHTQQSLDRLSLAHPVSATRTATETRLDADNGL